MLTNFFVKNIIIDYTELPKMLLLPKLLPEMLLLKILMPKILLFETLLPKILLLKTLLQNMLLLKIVLKKMLLFPKILLLITRLIRGVLGLENPHAFDCHCSTLATSLPNN